MVFPAVFLAGMPKGTLRSGSRGGKEGPTSIAPTGVTTRFLTPEPHRTRVIVEDTADPRNPRRSIGAHVTVIESDGTISTDTDLGRFQKIPVDGADVVVTHSPNATA